MPYDSAVYDQSERESLPDWNELFGDYEPQQQTEAVAPAAVGPQQRERPPDQRDLRRRRQRTRQL